MAPKKVNKKVQYYTVVFERYIEVMEEVNKFHLILSDKLKDLTSTINISDWCESPISEFMECFIVVNSYKIFLDDKINNPTEEEIKFTSENNIKDVLFDEQELIAMQDFYIQMQAKKILLKQNYGFSSEFN